MKRKPRSLFVILFGVPVLLLLPAALIGSSVYRAGSIEFSVQEKYPGGCSVSGKVPAILVPAAIRLAPGRALDEVRAELRCELGDALEIVRAATRELSRCPDGVLVEVRTRCELVTVEKRNGRLEVNVDTPDEAVRASVPLETVRSFFAAI